MPFNAYSIPIHGICAQLPATHFTSNYVFISIRRNVSMAKKKTPKNVKHFLKYAFNCAHNKFYQNI